MDQRSLETALADLELPAIRYFASVDSTNDEARRWFYEGAADRSLVVAEAQTAGRGRAGRRWVTLPGVSLAFSLVCSPQRYESLALARLTASGGLAVRDALRKKYNLAVQLKWPNDVLINGSKVAGVLVENHWLGEALETVILGIGINVAPGSVSEQALPGEELSYPATCVENELGQPVERVELLHAVLREFFAWQPRLSSPDLMREWEASLAFRGEWVQILHVMSYDKDGLLTSLEPRSGQSEKGKVMGLTQDGALKLLTKTGEVVIAPVGEVRLLPPNKEKVYV